MISTHCYGDSATPKPPRNGGEGLTHYSGTSSSEGGEIEALILGEAGGEKELGMTRSSHCLLAIGLIGAVAISVVVLWTIDFTRWHIPICAFHAITGYLCPTCGGLRAMHALLHGRLAEAWSYNALVVLLVPWAAYGLLLVTLTALFGDRTWPGRWLYHPVIFVILASVALIFGILRNLPGLGS